MKVRSLWTLLSGLWEPCRWSRIQILPHRREKTSSPPTVSSAGPCARAIFQRAVASPYWKKALVLKMKMKLCECNMVGLNSHMLQVLIQQGRRQSWLCVLPTHTLTPRHGTHPWGPRSRSQVWLLPLRVEARWEEQMQRLFSESGIEHCPIHSCICASVCVCMCARSCVCTRELELFWSSSVSWSGLCAGGCLPPHCYKTHMQKAPFRWVFLQYHVTPLPDDILKYLWCFFPIFCIDAN